MPIFIDLFVIVVIACAIGLVVSQIIMPLISGEPFFPLLRKSSVRQEIVKAEKDLEVVAEKAHLQKVTTEIQRREAELEKKQ